ncbi:MAG: class I SAM-dependent RNA methyltransferase [Dehalococcoidia bacterium]
MSRRDRKAHLRPPAGETFRLRLESLSHHGSAIARKDGQVVFVAFGVPGEEVDVLIERAYPDYLEGVVTAVHASAPSRVTPRCEYFGVCGGCQLQHIEYGEQLRLKTEVVREQMRRIGHLPDVLVRPMLPSPEVWNYRNHARFSLDRAGFLGFIMRGRKRMLRIENCDIMQPPIVDVLHTLQGELEPASTIDATADPPRGRLPKLHQVAVRVGVNTGDMLVQPDIGAYVPEVESGQTTFEEELCGERFRVSASSFFQVNTAQAETLIRLVSEGLCLSRDDVLLDAYAGVGTFAKVLAGDVAEVIAIEVAASSVADGRHNTAELANVRWVEGEVERVLPALDVRPTAAVLDPSRQGCAPQVLQALIEAAVPRIAYVSCDPATLARDLRILVDGGYQVDSLQPVDLFPQTYHIENVAILTLRQGTG